MIRPGIQGSSHNIDPSDSTVLQENVIFSKYTRKHNFKNINKNHKKNKTKLLSFAENIKLMSYFGDFQVF